ncbi:hypothetical protein QF021_000377 [Acidovorax delafieldii]|nr:hypothetical protein [Acidovorax delafieldii]
MSLQTATDKVTTGVRNLTDDVLQSAQEAVQTTRAAADQSLDKAEASVRALRRQADPAIDDLAARAQDLAARSIDYCAETSARARAPDAAGGRSHQQVRGRAARQVAGDCRRIGCPAGHRGDVDVAPPRCILSVEGGWCWRLSAGALPAMIFLAPFPQSAGRGGCNRPVD